MYIPLFNSPFFHPPVGRGFHGPCRGLRGLGPDGRGGATGGRGPVALEAFHGQKRGIYHQKLMILWDFTGI